MRKHDLSVKPRILVADETRDLTDVYGYLFVAAGYRVLRAYDGLTAAALAKVVRPEIAVLNQYLPGLTGLDLLRELREARARTKVILTSSMDGFSALAARAAGRRALLRAPALPGRAPPADGVGAARYICSGALTPRSSRPSRMASRTPAMSSRRARPSSGSAAEATGHFS
jgi:CheY-like chemotaxis protein